MYTSPSSPARRSQVRRRWIIGIVLAVLALFGAGLAVELNQSADSPGTMTVEGSVIVEGCTASSQVPDLDTGTQVVITDQTHAVVALGALETAGPCDWTFRVPGVPTGRAYYSIEVGRRGTLTYSEDQIRGKRVQMTIG